MERPNTEESGRILRVILAIDRVVAVAACAAAAVMSLLVIAEVFARYVLASSIPFSNELARVMFVWTIFLGVPLALSRGRHVSITILDRVLPASAYRTAIRASSLASLVVLCVVFYKSINLAFRNWDQTLSTMPVSAGVYYLAIPIGIGVTIIYLALMTVVASRQFIEDNEETD